MSGIAWHQVEERAGHIAGRVLLADSLRPAVGASVWATMPGHREATAQGSVGLEGAFDLQVASPGRYEVRVARIGYAVARTEVVISDTTGVAITAVLVPFPMMLNSDVF
jgi:hypothetical protein